MTTPMKKQAVKVLDSVELAAIMPIHGKRQMVAANIEKLNEQLMQIEKEFHAVMGVVYRPWHETPEKFSYSFIDHTIYENVPAVDENGVKPELKVEK